MVDWSSPLRADDYAEYWDSEALSRLGVRLLRRSLNSFWPASGPRWDAFGRTHGGASVFVEAKAYLPELFSHCRASHASRERIGRAFEEVRHGWGVASTEAWFDPYYQYANRLAHAYLLNELNAAPASV